MPRCQICEGSEFDLVATEIREGPGRIMCCRNCGLTIQDLDWDQGRLRRYYETEYQQTNSLVTGREQTPREHFEDRRLTIGPILDKLRPLLKPGMRVLEVGCGAGALLGALSKMDVECAGIELHTPFVRFIKDDLGIEAYAEDVNQVNFERGFDLVISIDTLDHLPNPLETLASMRRLLSPGGRVYLEVPNRDDALGRYLPEPNRSAYRRFFWHLAHLFYFDRDSLAALFARAGLSADISCRHNYTLKNYLNWYFLGRPQPSFVEGTTGVDLFDGDSPFEQGVNRLMRQIEPGFQQLMADTFHGDCLCCVGRPLEGRQA